MKTIKKIYAGRFNFSVETGVAIRPKLQNVSTISENPFTIFLQTMDVGDSFLCQSKHAKDMTYPMAILRKDHRKRFITRKVGDTPLAGNPDTEVMVWRGNDYTDEEIKAIESRPKINRKSKSK